MRLYVISALVIAFLAILFALQNTNLVTIQFFIWEYQQSLALILLATLAIGVVIGLLVSFPAILRRNLKASRIQKQADTLTELVQEKDQVIDTEVRKADTLKQDYEKLLASLGVIEPVTGLLKTELLQQAIAAQLQQLQAKEDVAKLPTFNVLMFKARPAIEDSYPLESIFTATAQQLQQQASHSTWLYSDGRGIFVATTTGLDTKALTHYGEKLQAAILENPPTLPTGKPVKMDVSLGCAIADTPTSITADSLVTTARNALDQALQRGRNRVRVLHAS